MANYTNTPRLSIWFSQALMFAAKAHNKQVRKDTSQTPYIAHLLAVASLVLEAGGDEDAAIAALLHDSVEDTDTTLDDICEEFGDKISAIVAELSEDKSLPKAERKLKYADSILLMSDNARLVCLADKLHNLRSFVSALDMVTELNGKFYGKLIENLSKFSLSDGAERQLREMQAIYSSYYGESDDFR